MSFLKIILIVIMENNNYNLNFINMNGRLKKLQSETIKLMNETSMSSMKDRVGSPDSYF